jgi:protein ImuB
VETAGGRPSRIALPGQTHTALAGLPVAALRLPSETVADLTRLGLRRIADLSGQPRAGLARRFGRQLVQRLDQAMGVEPEPVSPAKVEPHFAVRLTFPDPIGLESDIVAALDRLLPALGERLRAAGQGARKVRLECHRADQATEWVEVGLARPSANPDRMRPLLLLKIGGIDAGFGIDRLRLLALETEPLHDRQHRGHLEAASDGRSRAAPGVPLDDLLGRIGARVGLEQITRLHPAESHIPEKSANVMAAAWSEPAGPWPAPVAPRPLLLWRPEPVTAEDGPDLPLAFRWRRRELRTVAGAGPERIAPEWWLDDPDWRSGVRDYWRVVTDTGDALWLYYAHGGTMSGGWFCHGAFR